MRGDPPYTRYPLPNERVSTPHARGSTDILQYSDRLCLVYPACAGIHPTNRLSGLSSERLPRMRGDPPQR